MLAPMTMSKIARVGRRLASFSLPEELTLVQPRLEKQVGAEDDEQERPFQRSHSEQFGDPAQQGKNAQEGGEAAHLDVEN